MRMPENLDEFSAFAGCGCGKICVHGWPLICYINTFYCSRYLQLYLCNVRLRLNVGHADTEIIDYSVLE
jgi:hypothetical protein